MQNQPPVTVTSSASASAAPPDPHAKTPFFGTKSASDPMVEDDLPQGSVVLPPEHQDPGFGPGMPGSVPTATNTALHSAPVPEEAKKSHRGLIEIIILVLVSIVAVTFIGLFIWKYLEWDTLRTDVNAQIDEAVAVAVANNTTQLETEFVEREKYPYKTFAGPADYGSLNFEYPKTWNLYIGRDAVNGGDYEAYLNPGEVLPVSGTTINALRVTILDQPYDTIVRNYDSSVKNGKLTVETRNIGSTVGNVYTGEFSNGIHGIAALFKLRDKTVVLRTDAPLFKEEFDKVLGTVTFVE